MTEKEKIKHELFESINDLYSANYSCLRIALQDEMQSSSKNYTSSQIFLNSTSNGWLDKKLTEAANTRNSLKSSIILAIEKEADSYKILNTALEDSKKHLVSIYNILFGSNKTFDDLFDGFICKDNKLSKYIEEYEIESAFFTTNSEIRYLMSTYDAYMDALEKLMIVETMRDVITAISESITDFGKPVNFVEDSPELVLLSKADIDDMILKSNNILKSTINEIKSEQKKHATLLKEQKKKNITIEQKKNIDKKIMIAEDKISNLKTKKARCEELINFVNELKIRFESANKDLYSTSLSLLTEGFIDIISGVKIPKQPRVSQIYAHRLEKNYFDYLYSLLSGEYNLSYENRSTKPAYDIKIFDI